ncbi:MAG: P-loop NTPase fold protein, partial [Anaerolineae bacterium]
MTGQVEKMYLEDVPIRTPDQDRLGRSSFAQSLADSILSWAGDESIVIGIHGAWGSGKTSILNLIGYFLREAGESMPKEKRPIILRFNPWNFAGQAELMSMFFHQLAASLRTREGDKRFTDLAKRIAGYSDFFEPIGMLLGGPAGS